MPSPHICQACKIPSDLTETAIVVKIKGVTMPSRVKADVCDNCGKVVSLPKRSEVFIKHILGRKRLSELGEDPFALVTEINKYI